MCLQVIQNNFPALVEFVTQEICFFSAEFGVEAPTNGEIGNLQHSGGPGIDAFGNSELVARR